MGTVRDYLEMLMRKSGMTQAALADRIGEDPTWLNRRIKGHVPIAADDIPRLAEALGVLPEDFFDKGDIPEKLRRLESAIADMYGVTIEQARKLGWSISMQAPETVSAVEKAAERGAEKAAEKISERVRETVHQEIRTALEEERRERAAHKVDETESAYEPTYADLAGLDAADVYRNLSTEERKTFRNLLKKAEAEKDLTQQENIRKSGEKC